MPLKNNRKVALSLDAKHARQWQWLDLLMLKANTPTEIYIETAYFPLTLVKQVFANGDSNTGLQFLVSRKTTLSDDPITIIYRTWWNVEPYHNSLKQNASLKKSSTQITTPHFNHLFTVLYAYINLEWLHKVTHPNQFALKSRFYVGSLQSAFASLRQIGLLDFLYKLSKLFTRCKLCY